MYQIAYRKLIMETEKYMERGNDHEKNQMGRYGNC